MHSSQSNVADAEDRSSNGDKSHKAFLRGWNYEYGLTEAIDREDAARLYLLAKDDGSVEASIAHALQNIQKEIEGSDVESGLKVCKDLQDRLVSIATAGSVQAKVLAGRCSLRGCGVEPDGAKAFEWFRQAASDGSVVGATFMALCLLDGIGTEPHPKAAISLLQKASQQRYPGADYLLGCCYADGVGVSADSAASVNRTRVRRSKAWSFRKSM